VVSEGRSSEQLAVTSDSDHLSDSLKISFLGKQLIKGVRYIVKLYGQVKEAVFVGVEKSIFGSDVAQFHS
jgi:hypothetical protein